MSSPDILAFILSKGVILSTAFVHLLQDAFDRLQDPQVKRYTNIGHWTGLIVSVRPYYWLDKCPHRLRSLCSLLVIFLVECMSGYAPIHHHIHPVTMWCILHRHFDRLCRQPPVVRLRTFYPKGQT